MKARKDGKQPEPFFSFNYDGKPSSEFLKTWELKRASRKLDDNRTEHTLTYTDPKTGLVVRCVGIEYRDYPCVEWTLFFKNTSDKDTPILSDIQALDLQIERKPEPAPIRESSCFITTLAAARSPAITSRSKRFSARQRRSG